MIEEIYIMADDANEIIQLCAKLRALEWNQQIKETRQEIHLKIDKVAYKIINQNEHIQALRLLKKTEESP